MVKKWKKENMSMKGGSPAGPGYMLGMIGAAVYYLHTSEGFWSSVAGLLKALVWPAFLVYHLLS